MNKLQEYKNYIGVFDSGVGGISVLKNLTQVLPNENFLFYGDSANAPYGEKPTEQVLKLAMNVTNSLISQGVKAIVIACNTATSVAVNTIRSTYPNIPIIGMEPAINLAAINEPHKKVLVMATPITLHLEKYNELLNRIKEKSEFISLECAGLAKRIEKGNLSAEDLHIQLQKLLDPYINKVDAIVLGCTHYPFIKSQIKDIMGDIPFYDGGEGTALELKRVLEKNNLLQKEDNKQKLIFQSSKNTEEELNLYKRFYELKID